MTAKGWNQSELGRQAGIERASISEYMRGAAFPSEAKLEKLASVLGTTVHEIVPEPPPDDGAPATLELKVYAGDKARLRVDRLVSLSTGAKIIELIERDSQ